jgi:hypothetical protein
MILIDGIVYAATDGGNQIAVVHPEAFELVVN